MMRISSSRALPIERSISSSLALPSGFSVDLLKSNNTSAGRLIVCGGGCGVSFFGGATLGAGAGGGGRGRGAPTVTPGHQYGVHFFSPPPPPARARGHALVRTPATL